MSPEILTMLGGFATVLVSVLAGFGWMVTRTDRGLARVEEKLDTKIERLRADVTDELTGLTRELAEVKVAIARIEGPRPRFLTER